MSKKPTRRPAQKSNLLAAHICRNAIHEGTRRAAILLLLLSRHILVRYGHIGHSRVGGHALSGYAFIDERRYFRFASHRALLRRGITELAARLRGRFGRRVLGPMTPPVDRIRGEYLAGLLLKVESGASSARARELLGAELKAFSEDPEFRNITVVVNVDPQ